MKLLLLLMFCLITLFADASDIFDYRNYKGHTDFTNPMGGERFNRTKYVLEKLAKENKLDLIKQEFEKLKQYYGKTMQGEGGYVSDVTILDRAAAILIEQLPENTDDIVKKIAGVKRDKKELQSEVLRANKYFKANQLSNIIKIKIDICKDDINNKSEIKNYCYEININFNTKITKTQKQRLIKLQNLLLNCKIDNYSTFGRFQVHLIDYLESYLIHYSIKNKDEELMKAILFKGSITGNGCDASYSEYITQNQYIPFYLHYPNIDKYLNQKEVEKAASRIYDMIDLYNQKTGDDKDKGIWNKYNSTFIFPDEQKEKEFKFIDFIKIIKKQSPRIAKEVAFYHMTMVLRVNGMMSE